MEKILIDKKYILEYIHDCIIKAKLSSYEISDSKYHHNTSYRDAVSICKFGILTLDDSNRMGIRNDSKELIEIMKDNESHVNGSNSVSLSVVGLNDLYPNEDEYDPFSPYVVDFRISSNLKTRRSSINYGNEFLSFGSINKEELKSIDIRLLKLLYLNQFSVNEEVIKTTLENYNHLKDTALELIQQGKPIPLREMSEADIVELDLDKLVSQPKVLIKK